MKNPDLEEIKEKLKKITEIPEAASIIPIVYFSYSKFFVSDIFQLIQENDPNYDQLKDLLIYLVFNFKLFYSDFSNKEGNIFTNFIILSIPEYPYNLSDYFFKSKINGREIQFEKNITIHLTYNFWTINLFIESPKKKIIKNDLIHLKPEQININVPENSSFNPEKLFLLKILFNSLFNFVQSSEEKLKDLKVFSLDEVNIGKIIINLEKYKNKILQLKKELQD